MNEIWTDAKMEAERQRLIYEMKQRMGGGIGGLGAIPRYTDIAEAAQAAPRPKSSPLKRLAARFSEFDDELSKTFNHVDARLVKGTVHVWVITKEGKSVSLEDDGNIFPSDTLITQIRMLMG